MEFIELNNGVKMPIMGLGVYQIRDAELCEQSVLNALNIGYRSIDTAAGYGNEEAVGNAVKKSGIPREELFITTKLWINDASYEKAKKAFDLSLKKLQLDYLDLYLIHQPFSDVFGAWRAMEELYRQGRIRAIGVSNFQPDRVMDLMLYNEIAPAVNQIEVHPFFQQVESDNFLKANNVQTEAWAPFAEGRQDIFRNELLVSIAAKHKKTVAQVILRWLIQRHIVVIPKSVHIDRMQENFDVFGFELTDDDMQQISLLDTKASLFRDHRDPETIKWMHSLTMENTK